jgi:hypothetical protein
MATAHSDLAGISLDSAGGDRRGRGRQGRQGGGGCGPAGPAGVGEPPDVVVHFILVAGSFYLVFFTNFVSIFSSEEGVS